MKKSPAYFENLDGLRFVCFFAVFLFHSFHTDYEVLKADEAYKFVKKFLVANGNLGVNFFFVLSGFLITYLLLKEQEQYGRIDVFTFWKKRVLRIWPLFYFCLFFGFIVFPQLKVWFGQQPNETANPLFYLVFLNNFDFINKGLPDASVLGVLWSVAIEEQFYLVWPLLLMAVPPKYFLHLFVSIVLFTLAFRALFDNALFNEYHTLSCIGDMMVGSLGALWIVRYDGQRRVEQWSMPALIALYMAIAIVLLFRKELFYQHFVTRVFERTAIAVLFVMVILEQNYARGSLFKMGRFAMVSRLGVITYGLYCLHFIGILVATHITGLLHLNTTVWQVLILDTSLALVISVGIAMASYRFFESPFLRLKDRLVAHPAEIKP